MIGWSVLRQQLTLPDGDGLAAEDDTISAQSHSHNTTPSGSLIGGEVRLAELLGPVRPERAMGRPADRIFVDTNRRKESAGDEVVARIVRRGSDDHAARGHLEQFAKVRAAQSDRLSRSEDDEVVVFRLSRKLRLDAEPLQ